MSSLFEVELIALSDNPDVDFDAIVGHPGRFELESGRWARSWSGIVTQLDQTAVEDKGLSTYRLVLSPTLWLASQRRNHRMFQHASEPDIVLALLAEWGIEPLLRLDRPSYKTRKYRVQYAEPDHAFIDRMLEDAGISYHFEDHDGETRLVLSDAPQAVEPRATGLLFYDSPNPAEAQVDWVSNVKIGKQVRPGKYTMRDHDYRRPPSYRLSASASAGAGVEEKLERYHYAPGAFLFGTDKGDPTPHADDRGKVRADEAEGTRLAKKRLDAQRGSARMTTFESNAHDLAPGMVVSFLQHPRADLGEGRRLLIVESVFEGSYDREWKHQCKAVRADLSYRPPLVTPRPRVNGVESATVVGPAGEEIHTDEMGRVRVHFHWDRESRMDERSSCWIHVSQPWGGAGFGSVSLPRVGQEVLVDFLGGDPDRPVIVGRVYTGLQKVPYPLPEHKTRSGWRSSSTGGTGGHNELMFEDAAGRELLNIQAERDLNKLVKNDENVTIGRDRTKSVGRDDALSVAGSRTKMVGGSERDVIAVSQRVSVGVNRATQVGRIDSTIVGETYTLMVMPRARATTSPASPSRPRRTRPRSRSRMEALQSIWPGAGPPRRRSL
ncbi:VgrG protein [Minicystis rosea]|nr:VgrG protein [Minicystis rosea]